MRRLVLLTGASEGIGRAAARAFVGRGDRVIGVARNAERLTSLGDELGPTDVFVPIVADVADAGSMAAMAERVLEERGAPDVIVANAGVGLDARFENTSDEALRNVLEVNVGGVFRTIRPFVQPMVARRSGRILIVSSIVGKRGIPYYAAYSASKFALHGAAGALRAELVGSGVTVGLVCPASTETDFRLRAASSGPRQRQVRPRRHSADSVASAIVRMAGSRRAERVLGIEAKLLVLGDRWAPRLIDRLLARSLRGRDG